MMEAMLALSASKKLRVITTKNFHNKDPTSTQRLSTSEDKTKIFFDAYKTKPQMSTVSELQDAT